MKIVIFLIMLVPSLAKSQNLTRVWEGRGGGVKYIKLVVTQRGDTLFGYTHDKGGGYCTATFREYLTAVPESFTEGILKC